MITLGFGVYARGAYPNKQGLLRDTRGIRGLLGTDGAY